MGETTGIGWTDATWNPWMGCSRVTPGCAHCYMFSDQRRYGHDPEVVRRSKTKFTAPLQWEAEARASGETRHVFTCSWSDWFIEAADEWRPEAWDIIRRTPHLTYQILTKRPENIADRLPSDWGRNGWANVWLGVSVEYNRDVQRAEALCRIPARVRFISAEPLLGPVDLNNVLPSLWDRPGDDGADPRDGIHWVIVGGESGPRCRPMRPEWAAMVQQQCEQAGIAFYFKQWGGHPNKRDHDEAVLDGRRWVEMPGRAA